MRRERTMLVGCLLGLLCVTSAIGQRNRQSRLLDRVEREVMPLYMRGDTVGLVRALSDLARKANDEQIEAVDAMLAAKEIPPTAKLLTSSRLALIRFSSPVVLPKPTTREVMLMLPQLAESVQSTLMDGLSDHEAMREELPKFDRLDEYENLFWDIHVLENQMRNARFIAEKSAKLSRSISGRARKKLSEAERESISYDFEEALKELKSGYDDLQQRKLEMRIDRLDLAVRVLNASDNYIDRLEAAFAVDLDGELLDKFIKQRDLSLIHI